MSHVTCWFARLPDAGPCSGRLVRAHLLPRQLLKREGFQSFIDDPRSWVPGCGGIMGNGAHHGQYAPDGPRPIPRHMLPEGLEEFAAELGLSWWLDRVYGPLEAAA